MKRYSQSFTRVVHVLLVVALLLTFAVPAFAEGGDSGNGQLPPTVQKLSSEDGEIEYLKFNEGELILYFPDDFVPDEQMLQSKPDWISLDEDGTLPAQVVVPLSVKIPRYLAHPEMEIQIPDENGRWHDETIPAMTIDLQKDIEAQRVSDDPYSKGSDIQPDRRGIRRVRVYRVRVVPALRGHCTKNWALGRVSPRVPTRKLRGHSSLPTWVPSHGSVTRWGFHRPNPREAKLCIPKSLYWVYIAPFSGYAFWVQWGRYNNPRNWWFTYPVGH